MPGFELVDHLERDAVSSIFDEGGVLFAHGFDNLRSRYHVRDFEKNCRRYFNSAHALALSSGTSALKCSLKALGVKPGDEVITQGFNFIATIEAIIDCGATPVICNIDSDLHFDVEHCCELISPRTRAIILVHMLGYPGPIQSLVDYISGLSQSIAVIEDACESVGSFIGSRHSGTCADVGVYSFDHGKNLTCGEGGMVLTDRQDICSYVASYSDHGHALQPGVPRGQDLAVMPGFNYRMTEMQAAVGNVQLKKLPVLIDKHRQRFNILASTLCEKFKVRALASSADLPSFDTFMLVDLDPSLLDCIQDLLAHHSHGTKNVPDAMYWHCSAFWAHCLSDNCVRSSQSILEKLQRSIALPILVSKDIDFYVRLANDLALL